MDNSSKSNNIGNHYVFTEFELKQIRDHYAFIKIELNCYRCYSDDVYAVIDGVEYNLRLTPDIGMRRSEFDAIYYCETRVVLNGVEVKEWNDGYYPVNPIVRAYIGTRPGYVILSDDRQIEGVPSDEIIHMVGGHPRDFGQVYVNLFPRKYYDKVIYYHHYLDPSLYFSSGKSIYKAKTGRMDKLELDLDDPKPDVLQTMIQLGICQKIDPTYHEYPLFDTKELDR